MKRPLLGMALIWGAVYSSGQQPAANTQPKEIQMYSLQKSGVLRPISLEVAGVSMEDFSFKLSPSFTNSVYVARISGPKAALRYARSETIQIVALLPHAVDPRQIRLHAFATKGNMRVSYLGRSGDLNTRSFHAQPTTDGNWLLEPSQLQAGEYCFSPKFNNDNYCFGVDN
jgi:hypothetical protein